MIQEKRKGRDRPESRAGDREKMERRDAKSAWALASPRFDGWTQHKHVTSDSLHYNRASQRSKQTVYESFDLDLSIDVGSNSELLLTPPKANQLLEDMFDNDDLRDSTSVSSHCGSLASVETESLREKTRSRTTYKDTRSTGSDYHRLDIDRYLFEGCIGTRKDHDKKECKTESDDNEKSMCTLGKLSNRIEKLEEEIKAKDPKMKERQERSEPEEDAQAMHRFKQLLSRFSNPEEEIDDIFAREQKEQIERMADTHEKALFRLKEEHKQDIIDLLCSRIDLVRHQGNTILQLKYELDSIRREYIVFKETSAEALDKATQAVVTNCSTLKSYVQEEIRDSETQGKETIMKLEHELKCAYKQIASTTMTSISSGCKVKPQPRSMSSSLESSAKVSQKERGVNATAGENEIDGETWRELKGHFLEAIGGSINPINLPPSDASIVSKLTVYDTCTADRLFKDICYKKKLDAKPRKRSVKSDSAYFECGNEGGGMDEGDEFLDALS